VGGRGKEENRGWRSNFVTSYDSYSHWNELEGAEGSRGEKGKECEEGKESERLSGVGQIFSGGSVYL